jgi:hypothetical protein
MELVTLKKMGLSKPEVARGIDPHVPYRQSAMSIDGPVIDGPAYSHEMVILDYVEGYPAFNMLPQGVASSGETGIANLCTTLVEYVEDRGGEMPTYNEGANEATVIAAFFAWIRERMFLIWGGAEETEMPLIQELLEHTMDAAFDSGLKLSDLYLTGLMLPDISADDSEELTKGGFLGFAVDLDATSDTSGAVILATAGLPTGTGETFDGWTFFPIAGTTVVDVYTKEVDSEDVTFIDIVV